MLKANAQCSMPRVFEPLKIHALSRLLLHGDANPWQQRQAIRYSTSDCSFSHVTLFGQRSFLQTRGAIARALSYQILSSRKYHQKSNRERRNKKFKISTSFIAKFRISLKEAKEVGFRLRVCLRCELLNAQFDSLVNESDELVRILATIVHKALRRKARDAVKKPSRSVGPWAFRALSIEH